MKRALAGKRMLSELKNSGSQAKRASILVVDDIPTNIQLLSTILEDSGYAISGAPSAAIALQIARLNPPDLVLLDVMMPGTDGFQLCRELKATERLREVPVIFITGKTDKRDIVAGLEAGAVDYVVKPFASEEMLARVRTHLKIHSLAEDLRQKNFELEEEIARRAAAEEAYDTADQKLRLLSEREEERWGIEGFIGRSPTLAKIFKDVRRLQNFNSTNVLITGESGTGKELVARALHFGSKRKGSFISVNCAAIPAELIESCFFGHMRGSFTGALSDRKGFFELAEGGTLFLDEIGDMPLSLQAKLLRVLEDKVIMRIGAATERKIDVRIVAATNANLRAKINEGQFREDLYYRLNAFTVELPPLRERVEDISLLAAHLLKLFAREMGVSAPEIDSSAMARLEAYPFPGNVREMKNIIERAMIECGGGKIMPEHITLPSRTPPRDPLAKDGGAVWASLTGGSGNFWSVVSKPYLERDFSRAYVKGLIDRGLARTRGSYKELLGLFGLPEEDYPKFMDFLRFHRLKPEHPASSLENM